MEVITRQDRGAPLHLHIRQDGKPGGPPVVFLHALGTELRIWDEVIARLPPGLHLVRHDLRGHGLSDGPPGPYAMGALVADTEAVMDALGLRDAVVVGLSIGGMVAQGLAVKRLDLVRAMVLSNTAARIGTSAQWQDRIDTVRERGVAALSDAVLERWFSRGFRDGPELPLWRAMLERTSPDGYAGCAAAVAGTDFYTATSGLRLPTLGIAGSEDGSTPPDLVRETVDLIPGARFHLMRGVGHLPCVEAPGDYADVLMEFLTEIGHV